MINITEYLFDIATVVSRVFFWVIIAVLAYVFLEWRKYKHTVIFRREVSNRTQVIRRWAKEWRDNDGAIYWKVWRMKGMSKIPQPPPEALDIDDRGRYFTEARYIPSGELKFCKVKFSDDDSDSTHQPLTSEDRILYTYELKKSTLRKKQGVMEFLSQHGGSILAVIVVVILLTSYKDIMTAQAQVSSSNAATTEQIGKIADRLVSAAQDSKVITASSTDGVKKKVEGEIPPS